MRNDRQICGLPRQVHLGNYEVCGARHEFSRAIHIYHASQPGWCDMCRVEAVSSLPGDLLVDYREHDPLGDSLIQQVFEFSRGDDSLLIHCAAGLGRSPTFAVIALMARGVDRFEALGIIAAAMWGQYATKHCPSFDFKRLNEIMDWSDRRAAYNGLH